MVDKIRKESLDLLRFPLAIVVLTIHTFSLRGIHTLNDDVSFLNLSVFKEANYFIDGFLRGQSVPIFFFISGYVFFLNTRFTSKIYFQKLKNRTKSLLVPYLFWNTFALTLCFTCFIPFFSSFYASICSDDLNLNSAAL